ncbi:hypothetical protein BC940DRAFT_294934 [Gongronella butleri]|nr:hypothetical protein BC940DRAFT_294934 [Gongronella butleri]
MQGGHCSAVFLAIALALLIIVNLGLVFDSTFLPDIYFAAATNGSLSLKYGVYGSCLQNTKSNSMNCTTPAMGYNIDLDQVVALTGEESVEMLLFRIDLSRPMQMHKACIVLPFICALFAFFATCTGLFSGRRSDKIPCIGGLFALVGFVISACGLALVIFTFMTMFSDYHTAYNTGTNWGTSIYLYGVSALMFLFGFIGYSVQCWNDPKAKEKYREYLRQQQLYLRRRRRRREQKRRQMEEAAAYQRGDIFPYSN